MVPSLSQRIGDIRRTLPDSVRLIAVTKRVPTETMRLAYEAGIRDFGENRLQEALPKQSALQDLDDITWHLIGHLQSNKVKPAIANFDWIHSVDSLKLAERLHKEALAQNKRPQICLQVKPLNDPDKYGWAFGALQQDLPILATLTGLDLRGLMTILPLGLSSPEALAAFQSVQTLAESLKFSELSMGMSGDYALAVKAGATMVRLGQTLFGTRLN